MAGRSRLRIRCAGRVAVVATRTLRDRARSAQRAQGIHGLHGRRVQLQGVRGRHDGGARRDARRRPARHRRPGERQQGRVPHEDLSEGVSRDPRRRAERARVPRARGRRLGRPSVHDVRGWRPDRRVARARQRHRRRGQRDRPRAGRRKTRVRAALPHAAPPSVAGTRGDDPAAGLGGGRPADASR